MYKRKRIIAGAHTYIKLSNLRVGEEVNVIGLVTVCHPPKHSNTCSFKLTDESNSETNGIMFNSNSKQLPDSVQCGDVLCLRKVLIKEQDGIVVIATRRSSTWMLFRKDKDYALYTSSANMSETSVERNRVLQLSKYQDLSEGPPNLKHSRLSTDLPSVTTTHLACVTSPQAIPPPPPSVSEGPSSLASTSLLPGTITSSPCQQSFLHVVRVSRPTRNRYHDTPLSKIDNQVIGNNEAGVVGIVKYFKPPSDSKGTDYFTAFCLIDESNLHLNGISCVLFHPFKHRLPLVCCPGEVVMLKGLVINNYNGCLQGRGHETCLVGVFPADPFSPLPSNIGDWYPMKDIETSRIKNLISWANKQGPILLNSKLDELTCGNYCSTICLVVAVGSSSNGSMLISVYDGTVTKSPIFSDASLIVGEPYKGLTSTVVVSIAGKCEVTVGDVVQLINICMVRSTSDVTPHEVVMELKVSDHSLYQGVVKVLPPTSAIVTEFKGKLPVTFPDKGSSSSSPLQPLSSLSSDVEQATLEEIKNAPLGSIYSAQVQVLGLSIGLYQKVEDLCQLRCLGCKTLYVTPRPEDKDFGNLLSSGDVCVCCDSEDELLEPNKLSFIYAFSLIIADRTGEMEVAVINTEHGGSLSSIKLQVVNLYVDSAAKHSLLKVLNHMTGGNDPFHLGNLDTNSTYPRPSLMFHITVYSSCTNRRRYKIIDTNLNDDIIK